MRRAAAVLALAALALALTGCPDDDPDCDGSPSWELIGRELDGAALAVQGRAADDVWVVGGGRGLPAGLVQHWDGERWVRPSIAGPVPTWWWVWTSATGVTWIVGDHAAVARIDVDGTVRRFDLGAASSPVTLFGVWGASDDDVWVVGGVPDGQVTPDDELIMRWDGSDFRRQEVPRRRGATFFKIWGTGPDDIWISGEGGTMWRWTGETGGFVELSSQLDTPAPALTVHGCSASEVYAVAGQALFAWDGQLWTRRNEPLLGSVANGVSCGSAGVLVVGNAGMKWRWDRATDRWIDERAQAPTATDLHGAWIDPAGRAWAAGGNFNDPSAAPRRGFVGVRGCPRPADLP